MIDTESIKYSGQVASIAGLSLFFFFYLMRHKIKENLFPKVSSYQYYRTMLFLSMLLYIISLIGTISWIYADYMVKNPYKSNKIIDKRDITLASIDGRLNKIKIGYIEYNAPISMKVQETSIIKLLFNCTLPANRLKNSIIRFDETIEAKLSSSGFEINSITPNKQQISEKYNTQWKWEITAKKSGKQYLHIILTSFLDNEEDKTKISRIIDTFEKSIDVEIPFFHKVSKFITDPGWQWLWAAIILPIIGFWGNTIRKKKNDKTE